ncbi:MAG: DMT family transporter [Sphingomonas sp.]|nr:DMT family transporter [Sphingomonas sp.]
MTGREEANLKGVILPFIIFTAIWGSTWIVIRSQIGGQLGVHIGAVPPQWSVAYRFIIAAAAMAVVARFKGQSLALGWASAPTIGFLGFTQFAINFNAVYLAERYITSGVVATVFALLLIPSSLLAWAMLGQKPNQRFLWGSLVAVAGVALLFVHELREGSVAPRAIAIGIGWTLFGMIGASIANVFQARPQIRHLPLFSLLAWSMAAGALIDCLIALAVAGPPVIVSAPAYWLGLVYLALFASVLAFSLYYPVVRRIGPARAAYSSMIVPIIAMGFSTWLEAYQWAALTIAGALLVLAGMALALSRSRTRIVAPDAA